jgi:hypothetical protein
MLYFVDLDNKLYKMQGTYIKIKNQDNSFITAKSDVAGLCDCKSW